MKFPKPRSISAVSSPVLLPGMTVRRWSPLPWSDETLTVLFEHVERVEPPRKNFDWFGYQSAPFAFTVPTESGGSPATAGQ